MNKLITRLTNLPKLLILVVFILIGLIAAEPVSAIVYGGVGGRPGFPRAENPRTNDIFIHDLEPGQIQPEGVVVINNSEESKTLLVYSADSTPSTDGGFACRQLSEEKEGVGGWITFGIPEGQESEFDVSEADPDEDDDNDGLTNEEEQLIGTRIDRADTDNDGINDKLEINNGSDPLQPVTLTLEGASTVELPFTITVPKTASVGEHNGCILIQEKNNVQEGESGINISTRTGLRVAVTIPGNIVRKLEIAGFDLLSRSQGGKIFHPYVRNAGNVSIDADVKVITKNIFGRTITEHGGQYSIYRDDTSEWNFEFLPTFWGGYYRSTLTVEYDTSLRAGIGVESGENKTLLTGPTVSFFIMPSITGLIIEIAILLLILAILILWWLSWRRKRWIKNNWIDYVVKPGDDIKLLAKKFNVSWKVLAKANRIKPPYTLSIKVPPPFKTISKQKNTTKKKDLKKTSTQKRKTTTAKKR
ncbi:MAG: LysM peptidoglycan-binding domain-containing protein [Patescibacteria group bacterium]